MDTDGVVYEGRGWKTQGAHTKHYNSVSIGISFLGNYTSTLPTDAQKRALYNFISLGIREVRAISVRISQEKDHLLSFTCRITSTEITKLMGIEMFLLQNVQEMNYITT